MKLKRCFVISLAMAGLTMVGQVSATELKCQMRFNMNAWSLIYKHASGDGMVVCDGGASMKVKLTVNAAGLTAGKTDVKDATADFTGLKTIADVLGTYADADASAGMVKKGDAEVLTKGDVSMAVAGVGKVLAWV